jgi:NAD(P)-binding Rossmann-like domain
MRAPACPGRPRYKRVRLKICGNGCLLDFRCHRLRGAIFLMAPHWPLLRVYQLTAAATKYPQALTGMRGQQPGSFDVAHAFAREGHRFGVDDARVEGTYDLVVVGGGISGLAAAWFYRRALPGARILILDNLEDFGGHAKRNEFTARTARLDRLWRQPIDPVTKDLVEQHRQGPPS